MAIAGSGGWPPSARVHLWNRRLLAPPPHHNVDPLVVWRAEQAAAYFYDYPKGMSIYVAIEDLDYLHDLLEEMDMIDPVVTKTRYDARGEPYHYYADGATRPQLCEIRDGWVWLMDAERAIHRSKLAGKFVKLIEAMETESPAG